MCVLAGILLLCGGIGRAEDKKSAALLKAAKDGNLAEVSAALKKKTDVNGVDEAGNTPLALAAGAGHAEVVQALVAGGASVNKANTAGITPVMLAAQNGHADVVKALLGAGADAAAADKRGRTLLFHEIRGDLQDLAKQLIESGANVSAKNEDAQTPLHVAAAAGQLEVVRALLLAKADVNARDEREEATPLLLAAAAGHAEVVRELVKAKADVGATNKDGQTALDAAVANDHDDVAALLKPVASAKGKAAPTKAVAKPAADTTAAKGPVVGADRCSGTLTVEGHTVKLVYAYLYPDTGTPPAVNLFLSDVPVDRKTLSSSFSIQDLSDAGKLHLVKIRITTGDKQPTSSEVYDSNFRYGRTGVVGAGDFKATTFTYSVLEGTISMPQPREVPEGTYQYKASFRAMLRP
jgi:ankyrin repeat protein